MFQPVWGMGRRIFQIAYYLFILVFSGAVCAEVTHNKSQAINWFDRMSSAFSKLNYDGVFVYTHGDSMDSLRIIHRVDNGIEKERIVRLDGQRHEIIRSGENVTCVHPADWNGDINHLIPAGPFAKSFIRDMSQLAGVYHIQVVGNELIAGYESVRLAINPKDEYRYGYKVWLDRKTGLLLKSILVHRGRVLERFQFTQLDLATDIPDSELEVGIVGETLVHYPLLASTEQLIEQKAPSWKLAWKPPGFSMRVQGIKRNYDGELSADTLTFSDGMTAFSVFIEKVPNGNRKELTSQSGATVAVAKKIRSGRSLYFVTVVGEIPLHTAQRVAASVTPVELTAE